MRVKVCNVRYQHLSITLLAALLCLPLIACVANALTAEKGRPTAVISTETLKPINTIRIEPTYTPTFVNRPIEQSQTVKTVTIPPTEVPQPIIRTGYSALLTGQYLVYFEFRNESTVNAVAKDGEVHILSSQPTNLLAISANGKYFLFPKFVYDFRKQAQIGINPAQPCTDVSISFDGRVLVAGSCPKDTIAIRTIDQDWIRLNGTNVIGNGAGHSFLSPDGKQVAFVNCKGGQYITGDSGIYIANVEACLSGAKQCNIQPKGPYLKSSCPNYLAWSPDSQFVAGADDQVKIVNIRTKQEKTLVDNQSGAGLMHGIAWSPDGKWLGYAVDNVGPNAENASLYMVPMQGGPPVLLNPNTSPQVWAWLDVIPDFKIENEYGVSIMGEGNSLREEPSSASSVVKTLHRGERGKIIDGPILADNQTWWKIQFGTTSGWVLENYDWFTSN